MSRALLAALLTLSSTALGVEVGEEVELSSAPVTAVPCALKAVQTGQLALLTSCALSQARKGLVVVDVADNQPYRLSPKSVRVSDLERAYGGGSVDVVGVVKSIDRKDGIPLVEVTELRVTPRPKAGAFKGCL